MNVKLRHYPGAANEDDGNGVRRRLTVGIGCCAVTAFALGWLIIKPAPGPIAATVSPDGRSIPNFLESIDDPDHVSNWRAGLNVTREFLVYCRGMSLAEILSMFSRGNRKSKLPDEDGKFFYAYQFRPRDMNRLVSHLTHFPFSPDPLEFWITVAASGSEVKLTEAKIIDKTAYP